MKKNISLITLVFSLSSFANDCIINSYAQIIKINRVQDESIISDSNCDSNIRSEFIQFIGNANGRVHSNFISEYLKSELKANVQIRPQILNVTHINDHITKSLDNEKLVIKNINSLISKSAFTLEKKDQIEIDCKRCNEPGNKDVSVKIGLRKHWLTANIQIKRQVYVLNKAISNLNQRLSKDHIKKFAVVDKGGNRYFEDIDNIQFYQFNKFLQKGDAIKINDLVPKTIIKYGDKVKLRVKNKSINLSFIGIASENGRYGDYIELTNPRSNKKITAKVINYKQAEIDL